MYGKLKCLKNETKTLKNEFLTPAILKVLCITLIQSQFDYACSAWYANFNKENKESSKKKYKLHKVSISVFA